MGSENRIPDILSRWHEGAHRSMKDEFEQRMGGGVDGPG